MDTERLEQGGVSSGGDPLGDGGVGWVVASKASNNEGENYGFVVGLSQLSGQLFVLGFLRFSGRLERSVSILEGAGDVDYQDFAVFGDYKVWSPTLVRFLEDPVLGIDAPAKVCRSSLEALYDSVVSPSHSL